ncbi:uncharacterized protein V6R79_010574 [Siganus canaliculatus]
MGNSEGAECRVAPTLRCLIRLQVVIRCAECEALRLSCTGELWQNLQMLNAAEVRMKSPSKHQPLQ